jgi:hypothetical protein
MMPHTTTQIADSIAQLQQQLEEFRAAHPPRTKLPESLWQSAVELARQHGVYAVAHPLRLDYTRLKERLGESSGRRRKTTKPAFVELIAPKLTNLHEFVIEIEASHGAKIRIQWRTAAPPDWTALLRAWRAVEG